MVVLLRFKAGDQVYCSVPVVELVKEPTITESTPSQILKSRPAKAAGTFTTSIWSPSVPPH